MVDEAWAILANLGVARWLQTSWKLSRALGVANIAVLHRLSDLRAVVRPAPSRSAWPKGCWPTRRPGSSTPSPRGGGRTGELLGLTETEAELVTQLRRGVALWKVGRRSFLVEHRLAAEERELIDTDAAMAEPTRRSRGADAAG